MPSRLAIGRIHIPDAPTKRALPYMTKTSPDPTHDGAHDDADDAHDDAYPIAHLPPAPPDHDASKEASPDATKRSASFEALSAHAARFTRTDEDGLLERVGDAVRVLAINDIPLRARVVGALVHLAAFMAEDFPAAARPAWRKLEARSSWAASKAGGSVIAATVGVVSAGEVAQLAELICDLHTSLTHAIMKRREVRT
jgi:hypothetical protein